MQALLSTNTGAAKYKLDWVYIVLQYILGGFHVQTHVYF